MKAINLIVAFLFSTVNYAQDYILEPTQVISNREIYLNSGLSSQVEGASRTFIQIDLPPNTVKWYYSFTTSVYDTAADNVNLMAQLTSIYLDPNGKANDVLAELKVPTGLYGIDVYLFDYEDAEPFVNKEDLVIDNAYSYYIEGTVTNTKQAIVEVDDVITDGLYLGIKNPDALIGVSISIEVVAIIKTTIPVSENLERATNYGAIAWTYFENGKYEKALAYCDRSLRYYEWGWVKANKGLIQLILGEESGSLDTYVEAISLIKQQPDSEYVFNEVYSDLVRLKEVYPNLEGLEEATSIIKLHQN